MRREPGVGEQLHSYEPQCMEELDRRGREWVWREPKNEPLRATGVLLDDAEL